MKQTSLLITAAALAAFSGAARAVDPAPAREILAIDSGKYEATIDTTETPDLTAWAHSELAPVVGQWYPKIVALLPSEGYEAPKKFDIFFGKEAAGVAATRGTHITCSADWYRKNLKGEALGSVVHELVHVVQQYGGRGALGRPPGWLVEGLADYVRWYLYEPQSHGADISPRRAAGARYDGSYRVSANFLNWLATKHGTEVIAKLNAASRESKVGPDLWKTLTGSSVEELGTAWQLTLDTPAAAAPAAAAEKKPADAAQNVLTDAEKAAGWKLLFNGTSLEGWHNFKKDTIKPGWTVKDGTLACVDPHNAGDIVTTDMYDSFELQLEYNISEGGNSGLMYHVTNDGGAAWATGPEVQLEDNAKAADPQRCGWLYALYQPPDDPKTGRPLDATKPPGQWNHVRLLISPEKCEHVINGVKYFEYVLGSEDFNKRVAASKFGSMAGFAKAPSGFIALQGDHGQVAFRNVKVRPIKAAK